MLFGPTLSRGRKEDIFYILDKKKQYFIILTNESKHLCRPIPDSIEVMCRLSLAPGRPCFYAL